MNDSDQVFCIVLTAPSWRPVVNRWPAGSNAMLVTGPSATATGPATRSPVIGFHPPRFAPDLSITHGGLATRD